jgi:hypothetical protein
LAGRKPAEAVRNFLEPLQIAASCVTKAVFVTAGRHKPETNRPYTLALGNAPVQLAGPGRIKLRAVLTYCVVAWDRDDERGPIKVSTASYAYDLLSGNAALLTYHWHPVGRDGRPHRVPYPHLHLGEVSGHLLRPKNHVPTGRVSFEAVLRFAISELDVQPLRRDAFARLARTEERFKKFKTW